MKFQKKKMVTNDYITNYVILKLNLLIFFLREHNE